MKGVGFAGGYLIGIPIYGYNYTIGRSFDYQDSLAAISMLGASSILVFHQFFLSLSVLSNFLAILKRIGEVLDMEEFNADELNNTNIDNVFGYDTSDFKFCTEYPQLTAIAGVVGSGKSTLLLSLMSKILKINKQMKINTTIAYVEQEPFIISGTLKDNILFGLEYDEDRMKEVIEVCCLEHDLKIFNKGLETEIGERGINASGGQKARISLARACYSNADVILLDDPLSAVDPDVAEKIFDDCINGFLRNKNVVLVTHQIQYLNLVQNIVIVDKFKVKMKGNFSELKNQGLDFEEILKSYENKEREDQQIFIKEEENISELYSDIEENHKKNIIKEEEEDLSNESWDDENLNQTQKELDQNKIYENIKVNDKEKIDVIEKEKKDEGEVKIRTWFKFFN